MTRLVDPSAVHVAREPVIGGQPVGSFRRVFGGEPAGQHGRPAAYSVRYETARSSSLRACS
ncbi:hypothetical protein [Kibdelosporangium philippinense]|uniref:hypothetical protein n=1 Tax=Kibdelosporangium philippinense TaxID=211113 RepID=UPI0036192785